MNLKNVMLFPYPFYLYSAWFDEISKNINVENKNLQVAFSKGK